MSQPRDEQQPRGEDQRPRSVGEWPRIGDQPPPREERPARPLLRTMLGDVLRRTRLGQGRTLADVARAARVSMPYLSEVERGRKEASSEVLAAICDALHIDITDLLAATGRDLAATRRDLTPGGDQRASIVRLDTVRSTRAAIRPHGPGDAVCQLAA
jgi:transcriptional regulator with XRE-family HTH domain